MIGHASRFSEADQTGIQAIGRSYGCKVRFESVSLLLAEIIEYRFSMPILLSLVGLLLVSALMFALILRRETTQRRWVAISEWARMNSMKLQRRPGTMPQPLDR